MGETTEVTKVTEQPTSNSSITDHDQNKSQELDTVPEKAPELALWRRFVGLFWDSYAADPVERKYIQKVDYYLFSYIMLGYFVKYLDQTNYSNAYVSGMEQDLNMTGNDLNYLGTVFSIGIIVGSVPAQLLQMKLVRPSVLIPACELTWSILVMAMAGAKNIETMYALRFLVGITQACAFPGYAALLGAWFGPTQLGKRIGLFENAEGLATMFSGYLQAALYTGLSGKGGLAGWRWLFIFDAIISIPIALWGFYAIPDLPSNTRARWLSQSDREYGLKRMAKFGRAAPTGLNWKAIKRVYFDWHIWAFVVPYCTVALSVMGRSYFNLWLKAEGYSVVRVNTIPTAGSALGIISALATGIYADRTGNRVFAIVGVLSVVIVANILLTVWYLPQGALFFSYFLAYVGAAGSPLVISWGQEICQFDAELRQLLVATANVFSYSFSAFVPVILFPTYDAPHYKFAFPAEIIFSVCTVLIVLTLNYFIKRELATKESAVTESGLVVLVTEGNSAELEVNQTPSNHVRQEDRV